MIGFIRSFIRGCPWTASMCPACSAISLSVHARLNGFPSPPCPSPMAAQQRKVWPSHDSLHQLPLQRGRPPAVPRQQWPPAALALGRAAAGLRLGADLRCVPSGLGSHALPPPLLQVRSSWPCPGSCLCAVSQGAMLGPSTPASPNICFPTSLVLSAVPPTAAPQELGLGSSQTLSSAFRVMVSSCCLELWFGERQRTRATQRAVAAGCPRSPTQRPSMLRIGHGFLEGGTLSFIMGSHPF